MNQLQEKLVTHCKDCTFAKYFQNVQIDCYARTMNPEEYIYTDNGDGWEYRVYDRKCQYYRGGYWNLGLDIEDKIERVRKEVEIKYNVIVECNTDREMLRKTVRSIGQQEIHPNKLIYVCYGKTDAESKEIFSCTAFEFGNLAHCPCVHEEFIDERVDWRDDVLVKFKAGVHLFLFIKEGVEIPPTFFSDLNFKIHQEDFRFGMLHGDNFLLVPFGSYFVLYPDVPLRYLEEELTKDGMANIRIDDWTLD